MSLRCVIRFAPVLEATHLLHQDTVKADRYLYRRGSLRMLEPLTPDPAGVPLIVNHDMSQRVGTVHEIRSDWDIGPDGVWWSAHCTVDDPPGWLRARETRASFQFLPISRRSVGDWTVLDDAYVTEVTMLSPAKTPADSLARVELLYDQDDIPRQTPMTRVSAQPADQAVYTPPDAILRRPTGRVLGVR